MILDSLLAQKEKMMAIVLSIAIVFSVITYFQLHNQIKDQEKYHQQEIQTINDSYQKELIEQKQLSDNYQKEYKELVDQYSIQSRELEIERNKKVKTIIKYYYSDQKLLIDKIQKTYNLKYVPTK